MSFSELAIKIRAYDHASSALTAISKKVSGIGAAAKASAAGMAVAGAGIAAVGAGIGYGLYKAVAAYATLQDAQQHLLTALPAGSAGMTQMAEATELARKASVRFNVSQEDVLENVYLGISAGLSFQQAMTNAMSSVELAKGTQGDIADTGRVMAQIVKLFGDASLKGAAATQQIQHFSDVVADAVRMKAFRNVGELNEALKESIGAAKAAHVPFNDLIASLAGFQQAGLVGAQAGTAFEESIQALAKGGFQKLGVQVATFKNGAVDVTGSLINLVNAFHNKIIDEGTFEKLAKSLGIRGQRALALNAADLEKSRKEFSGGAVNGAALQGALITMQSINEQIGRAVKAFSVLEDSIGVQLGPIVENLATGFATVILRVAKFAEMHPRLVKFVAVFAAISAGVLIVVGGLLAMAGAVAAGVAAFAALGVTGPIIAGVLAIGVAFAAVVAAIAAFAPQFFKAGFNIAKSIADGILSGIEHPIAAISKVASAIGRYVIGHSPPPAGALRNLNRTRIVETLADNLRPHPAIRAMSSVAAGMAMAGMMGMGTPAYAGSRPAAPSIVINMPIKTGDVYDGDGFARALREHRTDLYEVLEREISKRSRADY